MNPTAPSQYRAWRADLDHSWVMLDEQGKKAFIPLPRERILAESPPRTAIVVRSATTGGGHNGPNPSQAAQPFNLSTSSGVAYITSQRVRDQDPSIV